MTEFWEKNFIEKQTMWGFAPSESAIIAKDIFKSFFMIRINKKGISRIWTCSIFGDR